MTFMAIFRKFYAPDDGGGTGGDGGGSSGSGSSLLDGNPPADENTGDTSADDETVNGKLDPFKDLEEYKDADSGLYFGRYKNVIEVFKGKAEADKELGRLKREKPGQAPEAYEAIKLADDQDIPEDYRSLEINAENDPQFKFFEPFFKEAGLTQKQVEILAKASVKYGLTLAPDVNAERQKLGAEGETIINDLLRYKAKRNTEAFNRLASIVGTDADMMKEMHFLLKNAGSLEIPAKPGDAVGGKTWKELEEEALAYKEKHKDTIDSSPQQQETYTNMMMASVRAKKKAGIK